jgi:hypothetical protein
VQIAMANGGVECEGATDETRDCELQSCPVDCSFAEWGEWSECTEQCGKGETSRTRAVATPTQFGGATCDGEYFEVEECEIVPCPVDCAVSEWEAAGDCSVSCGGGTKPESRSIQTPDQFSGEPCPTDLTRSVVCGTDECPIDCVMSSWIDDGSCSVTCGGGELQQTRTIQVQAAHGGVACEATFNDETDKWEGLNQVIDCNTLECPVDCVWGEWIGWPECSEECGTGERTRSRTEDVKAAFGGESCVGDSSETEACNEHPCPIDCLWSEWNDWGQCDEICGPGISERTRTKLQTAQFGGAQCEGLESEQVECEIEPCPVDCVMSAWKSGGFRPYGACTKECGGGKISEERTISVLGEHGGAVCPETNADGIEKREGVCNATPCPVNCELTDWEKDGSCSKTCGGGEQIWRKRVEVQHAHGGEECVAEDSEERYKKEACNEEACPVDCVMSQWTGFSACSASCDKGSKSRTRDAVTVDEHGGVACPTDVEEVEECFLTNCPIDCQLDSWSSWTDCSSECGPGTQTRGREIGTQPQYGGAACEAGLQESKDCEVTPCPVDCDLGDWTNDGECSAPCGGGLQKQTRDVKTDAAHGGEQCGATSQSIVCNEQACPVDCVLSAWKDDGTCTATCGGGQQRKIKTVETGAANGGAECPAADSADMVMEEACNEQECPVDCVVSQWSGWGECSATCEAGEEKRTREVTTDAEFDGVPCPAEMEGKRSCNLGDCPVDCVVGDWGNWSTCTATCGEPSAGTQKRTRPVTQAALHGGVSCDSLEETRDECPDISPCPVDCVLDVWADEGECSKTCGGNGQLAQKRAVITAMAHGGKECGVSEKTITCGEDACPVDCKMSDWTASGTCTRGCGGGVQHYRRYVEVEGQNGGEECPGDDELVKFESCNEHACQGSPQGEAGAAVMSLGGGGGTKTVTLNVQYHDSPVVIVGPMPKRSETDARVVLASVAKKETKVARPLDETKPKRNKKCKCTGGPSNAVPFGEGNVQYPAAYATYCKEWAARNPEHALAQEGGKPELTYLGEGLAYNPLTKMRVSLGDEVPRKDQTKGAPVVIPKGMKLDIPDSSALQPGVTWPDSSKEWCYVSEECDVAQSDGWGFWAQCEDGAAFDDHPPAGYPEVKACPLPEYNGKAPLLTLLTRKYNSHSADVCVGQDEFNECHDGTGIGGYPLGLVSDTKLSDDMVMLQRAYNAESKDTCVFPEGEAAKFCKSQKGAYGDAEDLGYAFTKNELGSYAAKGTYNAGKLDSCFSIDGGDDGCGEGEVEDLGVAAYLLDEAAADAWAQCGKQERAANKWEVVLEAKVDGEVAENEPNTERVAWAAFNQGSFETSSGIKFQAGIAYVPAGDGEFHEIEFHEKFSEAPIVISNVVGRVEELATELDVTAVALKGNVKTNDKGGGWYAPKSATQLVDGVVIEDWKKKDFPGIGFAPGKSSVTLTLAGAADVSEITIGYGVNEKRNKLGPDSVKVKCSMDGENWEKIGAAKDFRGLNFHNDEFIPVSGTCLKLKLVFQFTAPPTPSCACIACGYAANSQNMYPSGVCGTPSNTCSATAAGAGCYSSDADHNCDCAAGSVKGYEPGDFVIDDIKIKGTTHPSTIRQREAESDKYWVKAEGTGTVQVHWVAFEPTPGYLSSYPFAAGIEDGVGAEAKELKWEDVQGIPEQKFSQQPLVFTTVATDRADSAVEVRVTENTPEKMALVLQGDTQDEKISYFVFNGAGYVGSVIKAVATLQMSYFYEVGGWSGCTAEGGAVMGKRTREVKCKGTNGAEYSDVYCPGFRPSTEAQCQTTTFFLLAGETGQCLKVDGENKKKAVVHYRNECKNNKNKFRLMPTGDDDESFFLQNFQSGLCLGSKYQVTSAGKLWLHNCEGDVNKLTMSKQEDGTVVFKSAKDPDYCITTQGDVAERLSEIRWGKGCEKSKNTFMLVDAKDGELAVSNYELNPNPGDTSCSCITCGSAADSGNMFSSGACGAPSNRCSATKGGAGCYSSNDDHGCDCATQTIMGASAWYLDDGVKLTDMKNSRKWSSASVQLGVGWGLKKGSAKATITLNLEEAGPIAAVVLGYNTKDNKDVKVPKEVKVMCSKDGSAWSDPVEHTKSDFSTIGKNHKGNTILFNMESVCTGDEKHVKVEAKAQSNKKMVFDEVDVYRPAKME